MKTRIYSLCCLVVLLSTAIFADAAVLIDPNNSRNLTAPTGALADSGWQYQGNWTSSFLGTPITPNHFITAKHVGGQVGGGFSYQGQSFTTTAVFKDPDSDLAVWQINGVLDSFAPLYTKSDEVGKEIVVFGRGTDRGDPVTVGTQLKGWRWGAADHAMSWGQNTVSDIFTNDPDNPQTLRFTFDANAGLNEAQLTSGDSGGAVFIQDSDGVWKLAGINYAATGRYQFTSDPAEAEFSAALFDESGLFVFDDASNVWVPASGLPGASFATRISSRIGWIHSVVPEPSTGLILIAGGSWWLIRRRIPARPC